MQTNTIWQKGLAKYGYFREMRERFDEHGLIITAAVSAGYSTIDQVNKQYSSNNAIDQV